MVRRYFEKKISSWEEKHKENLVCGRKAAAVHMTTRALAPAREYFAEVILHHCSYMARTGQRAGVDHFFVSSEFRANPRTNL